ncbi:spore germination protein [Neobacillus mesonae]|nr:spore germination protein [Neobacillus mesonae]
MNNKGMDLLSKSADFVEENLHNGVFHIKLIYLSTMVDTELVKDGISRPFMRCDTASTFHQVLFSTLGCSLIDDKTTLSEMLLSGNVIIVYENRIYKMKAPIVANDQPLQVSVETTIQGSQTGFSENIDKNLLLLRQRYPYPELKAEKREVGKRSKTPAYLVYDQAKIDSKMLADFDRKLSSINAEVVQAVGQIEALMTGIKYRLFPTMVITERPDRVVSNLAEGKIVLLLEGTPFVLISPAVFFDFMSAMDDLYQSFFVTRSLVILRYIALLITIILPGMYIAIVSFNPEIFRAQFALTIAGSRSAVPYPSYVEVLIMMFLIEALIEASLRLPRYIGSTATTVGGLILGQAAQQAGMISSIMVVITSAVAISNFLIPINAMSFAIRVVKYPIILLASFFGMAGVVCGLFCILIYMSDIRVYGRHYLRLFVKEPDVSGYKEGDPY